MYLNRLLILKKLQQANTHLGSMLGPKNSRWSRISAQRAQSYIFGFRAAQPIFDLDKTVISLRRACNVIQLIVRSNGHLLFINTNPKYNKIIQQTAMCTNQSYINHKWIGGFLTNWNHMQNVQQQFQAAAKFTTRFTNDPSAAKGRSAGAHTQDITRKTTTTSKFDTFRASCLSAPRYKKMQKCFSGCLHSTIGQAPDCVIIFNANQHSTAIYEAHLNQIPIISLVDSNIPNELYKLITYPIPANYDSVQFIYLFCNCILKILISREVSRERV